MIDYFIKKARLEDVPEIGALITSCWKNSYKKIIHSEYLNSLNANERTAFLTDALLSGGFLCDCAWSNQKIIGMCLYRTASVNGLPGYGELSCLYVENLFQNSGIGSKLLNVAAEYIRGIGLNYIILNVLAANLNAVEFYRKRGFVEINENQVELGERVYPFLLMRKSLN